MIDQASTHPLTSRRLPPPLFAPAVWLLLAATTLGCKALGSGEDTKKDEAAESEDEDERAEKKRKKKRAPSRADGSASAAAASASTAPPPRAPLAARFDRAGLTLPGDDCPLATMTFVAPGEATGVAYQMLVAFAEAERVRAEPSAPHHVQVLSVGGDDTHGGPQPTTVARCGSGLVCNEIAAFLFRLRSFPKPQVWCGKGPFHGREEANWSFSGSYFPPKPNDTAEACARISACALHADPSAPKDAYKACLGRPTQHKLACAEKASCAEVVACTKG